jgi:E3 ubiquitin-protein ligase UBR4
MQNLEAQAAALQGGGAGGGHLSDTTASAPCSDDEGSNAATDGSTLRTSPAEAAGSESGGSGAESLEMYQKTPTAIQGHTTQQPKEAAAELLVERLLLEKLLEHLPRLKDVAGVQAIPLLQVIIT